MCITYFDSLLFEIVFINSNCLLIFLKQKELILGILAFYFKLFTDYLQSYLQK